MQIQYEHSRPINRDSFIDLLERSTLAVDLAYQHQGIGKELIRLTQSRLGERATVILLAAPKATEYYPGIGFERHDSAWIIPAKKALE